MRKSNNKLLIILLIVVIIVMGVFCYLFVTERITLKNKENKNIVDVDNGEKSNNEPEPFALFTLKEGFNINSLMGITEEGEEKIIYDFSKFDSTRDVENIHYYYDKKSKDIYIVFESWEKDNHRYENWKLEFYKINLSDDDYNLEFITSFDKNNFDKYFNAENITIFDNYIYFSSSYDFDNSYCTAYKINLRNKKIEVIETFDGTINFANYDDKYLIYSLAGNIYKYDDKNGSKELILEKSSFEYIYGDEIIYEKTYDNEEKTGIGDIIDYSYNLENGKNKQISENIGRMTLGISYTAPYNNSYLSINSWTGLKYDDKTFALDCNSLKLENCDYADFGSYYIYSDKLVSVIYINEGPNAKHDFGIFKVTIDLSKQEIINTEKMEDAYRYSYVSYIK